MLYGELGTGWLCFLCNVRVVQDAGAASTAEGPQGDVVLAAPVGLGVTAGLSALVVITPKDSYHRRIYLQPLGLYLHAEAGMIAQLDLDMRQQRMNVSFGAVGEQMTRRVRLRAAVAAEASQEAGLRVQAEEHGPCRGVAPACMAMTVALVRGSYEFSPCLHTNSDPWLVLTWSWHGFEASSQ